MKFHTLHLLDRKKFWIKFLMYQIFKKREQDYKS